MRAVAAIAGLMVLIAGCGGRPARSADGRTRLELWTLALSTPALRAYMEARVAAFEGAHPAIDVVWVDVPYEALDRKLIAAAAAGRAPDVVNLSDGTFARFVRLGGLLDIAAHVPGDPDERYLPGALGLGRVGGDETLFALPWYLSTQVGLVNTELLARGGMTERALSRDWAALLAQAADFRARTGAYLCSQPLGEESQLLTMMLADAIVPLREDPALGRLKPDLLRDDVQAFVRSWWTAYREGSLPPEAATRGHAHLYELYQNRRVAVIDAGVNFVRRVRETAPSVHAVTAVRSGITGSLGRSHIATMLVGVTVQTAHPREAAALAWFLTGEESQQALCETAQVLPSTRATLERVIDDLSQQRSESAGDAEIQVDAQILAAESLRTGVAFIPALAVWPDLRRAFEEGMKSSLLDGIDPAEALTAIQARWSAILDAGAVESMAGVPRPEALPSRLTPPPAAPGAAR